ncbi:hypothetical protein EPR50_G00120890 [Perca flavescens]|uniref:Uncharacterized protein n=1 Tax=Perca flavescens TaxID=8167 RepID=A0A484CW44_PERFV|nr:hypothetical protein EPR50_G00120890 [Perca flavescens]
MIAAACLARSFSTAGLLSETAGYATRKTSWIPSREREGLIPVLPQVPAALHPNFPYFPLLLIPFSQPH